MNAKHSSIAKCFKQSSKTNEENNQIFVNKHILQSCLNNSILRRFICSKNLKERSDIFNWLKNIFSIFKNQTPQKNNFFIIDYIISKNEANLYSQAAAAPMYEINSIVYTECRILYKCTRTIYCVGNRNLKSIFY